MYFNPNEPPPRPDDRPGQRQDQHTILDTSHSLDQQEQALLRDIMARSPTTTIPIPKPARGRQQ
jgi:hypothetical protein